MRNRICTVAVLLLTLLFSLCGCARQADYFAPLRGAFEAEIDGTWHDTAVTAVIKAEKAPDEGARELTVTFYAPSAWRDTVLTQGADGTVTLTAGEVKVSGKSLAEILTLFEAGEVKVAELDQEGHTVVSGEGFSLTLLSDGTPIKIERGALSVTVVRFEAK